MKSILIFFAGLVIISGISVAVGILLHSEWWAGWCVGFGSAIVGFLIEYSNRE